MKRNPILLVFIAIFLFSFSMVDIANAQEHCEAGWNACMDAADNGDERADCVDAWLACIGYEREVS